MRSILSAAGRAAVRDAAIAFLVLGAGIWAAPNLQQAGALAAAASIGATIAAVRAIRVFVPGLSEGIARALGVPVSWGEIVVTGITTALVGFCDLAIGVLSAPDLESGKAAAVAGLLAIGTALTRLLQAWLTPGEAPVPALGVSVPPQPVPPAALPPTR